MKLKPGQVVHGENTHTAYTVQRELGEGGQGTVYLVKGEGRLMALKWYNDRQSTLEQQDAIRVLVRKGAPIGAASTYIWPHDLIDPIHKASRNFGYVMPVIDIKKYVSLGGVQGGRRSEPTPARLCDITFNVASSFRELHVSGLCYRDISGENVMFDPLTGDIIICDNDNIAPENDAQPQILGTFEFMAPEIILGQAKPSSQTDKHSLAVYLFMLWMWHHPLHGKMEYAIRSWDDAAKKTIYGATPIFIFNKDNKQNSLPENGDYEIAESRWKICPEPLREKFLSAFTTGLTNPNQRVSETAWRNAAHASADSLISCSCKAQNFVALGSLEQTHCWACRQPIPLPPWLKMTTAAGIGHILLQDGFKLLPRHLGLASAPASLGEIARHPANPAIIGLKNLTNGPWQAKFADGTSTRVEPGKSVPLTKGVEINFSNNVTGLVLRER